mmetsp:Transcript_24973/g.69919  ORF Transcript_24973/g.69919 Transcript_24973/m.69919 type:complete len:505 (+) Transcript_24973:117-1631(+)
MMMLKRMVVCFVLVVAMECHGREAVPPELVHARPVWPFRTGPNHGLYDSAGRRLLFRGTNFVQKGTPWYPEVLLNASRLEQYAHWGFNAIRLGYMWSGVETAPGVYDKAYAGVMREIIENGLEQGVYSLIDNHQDVLSSFFCTYDGVPPFYVNLTLPDARSPFPQPLPADANGCAAGPWFTNYMAESVGQAFQEVYDNAHGLRDAFEAYWTQVAANLVGVPILGYDLWNEPFCGDWYSRKELFVPGVADTVNVGPLYDRLADAISTVDENNLFLYEPVTWGIYSSRPVGSGFLTVPGGLRNRYRSVFNFHYYCAIYSVAQEKVCDEFLGPQVFDTVAADLRRLGGSSFLSEWGSTGGCFPHTEKGREECYTIMQLAQEHYTSWTNWDWGTGRLQNGWDVDPYDLAVFAWPYPQALAGSPSLLKFDPASRIFRLTYEAYLSDRPSLLSVPFDIQYPTGYKISHNLNGTGTLAVYEAHNRILILALPTGTVVDLTIAPSSERRPAY